MIKLYQTPTYAIVVGIALWHEDLFIVSCLKAECTCIWCHSGINCDIVCGHSDVIEWFTLGYISCSPVMEWQLAQGWALPSRGDIWRAPWSPCLWEQWFEQSKILNRYVGMRCCQRLCKNEECLCPVKHWTVDRIVLCNLSHTFMKENSLNSVVYLCVLLTNEFLQRSFVICWSWM